MIKVDEESLRKIQDKLYDHAECRTSRIVIEEGNEIWDLIDYINKKLDDRPANGEEYKTDRTDVLSFSDNDI